MILDSCYKLYGESKQWKDAQRKCNEDGANLLTLESLDELVCDLHTFRFLYTELTFNMLYSVYMSTCLQQYNNNGTIF